MPPCDVHTGKLGHPPAKKNAPLDEWGERFKKMVQVLQSNFEREEKELFPLCRSSAFRHTPAILTEIKIGQIARPRSGSW